MNSCCISRIRLFSVLLLLAGHISCSAWRAPRPLLTPPAVRARLELQSKEELSPYDQPDEARAYFLMKRAGADGNHVDLVREYRRALDRMERMPRYSTRSRRALPSLYDVRHSTGPQSPAEGDLLSTWEPLGPGNIGGRTRALLINPNQPEIMYAAGVSGGIWKTGNAGQSWRAVTDLLPNIAVNSMAMDPSNPRIIYAGTGEGYFREVVRGTALPLRGEGILKTEDGGESWVRLQSTSTADFYWVNGLVISRNDPHRVYAATRTGVWRSPDGGQSWTRIHNAENVTGGCLDLVLRTDRANDYLFAACGTFEQATVYLNAEAELNDSWTPVLSEPGMGRTSLAIAPSNQDTIYSLSTSYVPGPNGRFQGGLHAVFRSDQGGAAGTWQATVRNTDTRKMNTLLLTNPIMASYVVCGLGSSDGYSTLGWYTNVIAVDPVNPEIVWGGGVDLFRSDDGGHNWGPISYWAESPPSAHADQHVIVFHPGYDETSNQTMFVGGDGGVWRTDNPRTLRSTAPTAPCSRANSQVRWTSLNHNYGVTQFYYGVPFPDGKSFLGGTQDNGTVLGSDQSGVDGWIYILGGDGGYVAVDPDDPRIIYAESQNLNLRKSVDGGRKFVPATNGITESTSGFLFITPFVMDPNNSKRLWAGGRFIWRTSDGAESWTQAGVKLTDTASVSALAVAPSSSDLVLIGRSDGFIHRHDRATSTDYSTSWPSSRPRPGFVTSLTFDPIDPQVAYATYAEFGGKHVWKTADGGETWIPIDGEGTTGLPDIPVHALAVDPNRRQHLYLATDLGVFTTRQGGNIWAVENSGFANVVTESLYLQQQPGADPVLWAFTHGRGAWRVKLAPEVGALPCTPERWVVHVTPANVPYATTLIATSAGKEETQVELVPYGENGIRLASVPLRVKPGETRISPLGELLSGQPVSHFGVCGSSSISVTAAYRSTAGLSASAHVPETALRGTEFLLYPAEWNVVFDGLAIVNLGAENSQIEAALLNEAGAELLRTVLNPALPPYAKQVAVLDNQFQGLRGAAIRVRSSQPSTLLFLRGTHANTQPALLYQTEPVTAGQNATAPPGPCTPRRWIPHVTASGDGYDTNVLATNFGASNADLELVPFREDGTRLNSVSLTVPAGNSVLSRFSDLFQGVPASHFGVCGPPSVRVTSGYRAVSGMSASAHVPESTVTDTKFLVYPGEWQVVFEGMAIVNRGTKPARVEAILMDTGGIEVQRVTVIDGLMPGAKKLALLDAVFARYDGAAIRIESSEPSSLLLLRGTHSGVEPSVLYQTLPIALTPRQ